MKIVIGNDHAGVDLKNKVKEELRKKGHEVINVGTDTLDSVDYPDIAALASEKVLSGEAQFGILICGTGIGISIAANKIKGIRAALAHNEFTAKLSRLENSSLNFIFIMLSIMFISPFSKSNILSPSLLNSCIFSICKVVS